MAKRRFLFGLALFSGCLLTNRVTRWVVRADVRADFHEAVNFAHYRGTFETFLAARPLQDAEQVGGDRLPPQLAALGVLNVYRNGRFVYFVLEHTGFLADDATSEFIWQLDRDGSAIETILSTGSAARGDRRYFSLVRLRLGATLAARRASRRAAARLMFCQSSCFGRITP